MADEGNIGTPGKKEAIKNVDKTVYKEMNKKIRRRIKVTKEEWKPGKYLEIVELNRKYDSRNIHKKSKEMCGG